MKEDVIKELKSNADKFISGEQLSEKLQVSRTAVWKWISQLKAEGYIIESQTRLGYKLIESPEKLYSYELLPYLKTKFIGQEIVYLETVDSTNNYAKKIAEKDFKDGTVVIADEQHGGRGRMGRAWVSPKGEGIWMTIMLKPEINPKDASQITLIAAMAVCSAIKLSCGLDAKIKWPNDIVSNGKKLCGILTEMNAEIDNINYLIVGIGINANINKEEFDKDLEDKATSIKLEIGQSIERRILAANIINEFEKYYIQFIKSSSLEKFIAEYKKYSATLGKEVRVIGRKDEIIGTAEDITIDGQLLIRLKDNSLREVSSGEVSVRGIYGYI